MAQQMLTPEALWQMQVHQAQLAAAAAQAGYNPQMYGETYAQPGQHLMFQQPMGQSYYATVPRLQLKC